MPWHAIIWTDAALEKIAGHGVSQDEAEQVVFAARAAMTSRSSGRPMYVGQTRHGRRLVVVFEWIDEVTIEIITAFEPQRS